MSTEHTGDGQWGWQALVKQARDKIVADGWPIPQKPGTPLNLLEIPDDVEKINNVQLANLHLRIQSWFSYGTAQLAFAQAELAAANEYFETLLGERMHEVSQAFDKREVKEILRSLAISQSQNLRGFMATRTRLDQRARTIAGLVAGLDIQCRLLQSEQIRRASERKLA